MLTHSNQSDDEAGPFGFFDSFLIPRFLAVEQYTWFEVSANGHDRLMTPMISGAWEEQTTLLA